MNRNKIAILACAGMLAGCAKSAAGTEDPGADGETATKDPNAPQPRDVLGSKMAETRKGKPLKAANPPKDPNWNPGPPTPIAKTGIASFSPSMASPGSLVTIFGGGFSPDPATNAVSTGGVKWEVVESSAGHMVARVPDGAKSGPIELKFGKKKKLRSEGTFGVIAADSTFGRPNADANRGLMGTVYALGGEVTELPAFDDVGDPIGTFMVDDLDAASGAFGGFPNGGSALAQWFGIHFQGSLNVIEAGEYDLCLDSDDGAQLYLESTVVVDNDGVHESTEACELVYMDPGEYKVDILYFQGADNVALRWTWAKDGGAKAPVPASVLFPTR